MLSNKLFHVRNFLLLVTGHQCWQYIIPILMKNQKALDWTNLAGEKWHLFTCQNGDGRGVTNQVELCIFCFKIVEIWCLHYFSLENQTKMFFIPPTTTRSVTWCPVHGGHLGCNNFGIITGQQCLKHLSTILKLNPKTTLMASLPLLFWHLEL